MSFAAPIFLWYFMPAILLLYWLAAAPLPQRAVALASLIFYLYGAGPYVFLLLACMVVNFAAGSAWTPAGRRPPTLARDVLVAAIGFDLGVLAIWKYAGVRPAGRCTASCARDLGGHGPVVPLALADRHLVLHLPPHVLRDRRLPAQPAGRSTARCSSSPTSRCSRS